MSPQGASPGHHIEHMFLRQQGLDPDINAEVSAGDLAGMTVRNGRAYQPWEGTGGGAVRKRRMISWPLLHRGGGMIDENTAWFDSHLDRYQTGNANARSRR